MIILKFGSTREVNKKFGSIYIYLERERENSFSIKNFNAPIFASIEGLNIFFN